MSCRTGCCKTLSLVLVLLALAVLATPAFAGTTPAQNCIQNEFNIQQGVSSTSTASSNTLVCTANDVRIAQVVNVRDPSTGDQLVNCSAGLPFSFVADFEILTTSKSSRSNVGLYIAETGTTVADALSVNNTCADNIIPPPLNFVNTNTDGKHPTIGVDGRFQCAGAKTGILCGTDYYDELDQAVGTQPDNCGDTSSSDAGGFGPGSEKVTLVINAFTCPTPCTSPGVPTGCANLPTCTVNNVTGPCAVLPNCTSWQVPGKQLQCVGTTGAQSYPTVGTNPAVPEAVPGDKSKCNCEVITLPILVQTASIVAQKACEPRASTSDPTTPTFDPNTTPTTQAPTLCSAGQEGATEITYTVAMTNTSNTGGVTINQICDSVYGTIYRSSGAGTLAFCGGALTEPPYTGTGVNGCVGPYDLAAAVSPNPPTPTTCTFKSTPNQENLGQGTPPNSAITDTVTIYGTGDLSGGSTSATSNSVTVKSTDAPTTVNTIPQPTTETQVCVTERFTATVQNNSSTSTPETGGETVFLTALHDDSVDLTTTSGAIVGTTCGVSTSLGTLSSSTPKPFPTAGIAAGASYTCTFDKQFCATPPGTVEEYGTGACNGTVASPGNCTNPGGVTPTGGCTTNAQCDATCTGVSSVDTLSAGLTGDDTNPADVITQTDETSSFTQCLVEPPFITVH